MSGITKNNLKMLLNALKEPANNTNKKWSKKEKDEFKETVFELRAWASDCYAHTRDMPSRDIAILGNSNLDKLANAVLKAFNFDNDHLYMFSDNLKNPYKGVETYEVADNEGYGERKARTNLFVVAQVFNAPKKKMLFLFDYGDEWRFVIQTLSTRDIRKDEKYPLVTNIKGEAPQQYEDWDEEEDEDED